MGRAVGRESLDIPKFVRESLDMGRESLDTDFCDPFPDFCDQILACPDFRGPRRDSCPDFQTQTFSLTMQFESKSGCGSTLGANHVQVFQIQTLGSTMQFWSESGCGSTLAATHVQTFQFLCPDFPDSNLKI